MTRCHDEEIKSTFIDCEADAKSLK